MPPPRLGSAPKVHRSPARATASTSATPGHSASRRPRVVGGCWPACRRARHERGHVGGRAHSRGIGGPVPETASACRLPRGSPGYFMPGPVRPPMYQVRCRPLRGTWGLPGQPLAGCAALRDRQSGSEPAMTPAPAICEGATGATVGWAQYLLAGLTLSYKPDRRHRRPGDQNGRRAIPARQPPHRRRRSWAPDEPPAWPAHARGPGPRPQCACAAATVLPPAP